MCASSQNVVILAAAGSRKTQEVIDAALAATGRVLITTYTNENRRQIVRRIEERCGVVPSNIDILGWYSFLIGHGVRPYQATLTGEPFLAKGLNFDGEPLRYTRKEEARQYFFDSAGNLYRCNLSCFAYLLNSASDGAVIGRLSSIYDVILVDEVQDLVGWDLDILDLLIEADLRLLLVGDPRQHTYATSNSSKNKKYRGIGMLSWFAEREATCERVERVESYRCHQSICDFADSIYPDLPSTISVDVPDTGHDGIVRVEAVDVFEYCKEYQPVVLRPARNKDTLGLEAINIGVSKGSTFDRVLIFPTAPMLEFLESGDPTKLKAPEALYVAVTRARFSAAFVV